MAVKHSVAVRNALLNAYETAIGPSPFLRFYTGAAPAATTSAASGTMLVEMAMPADWMGNAANGVKDSLGNWAGIAVASGVAGYYRILDSTKATTHEQGTISMPGGGGDVEMNNTNVAVGQAITVPAFSKSMSA